MRILVIILVALVAFGGGFLGVVAMLPAPEVEPPVVVTEDAPADTLSTSDQSPDSLAVKPPAVVQAALDDSLADYRALLAAARQSQEDLQAQIESMTESNQIEKDQVAEIAALSATLPKLEPAELQAILSKLDISVIEALYEQASSRNRTSILQALSPDRAAAFVHRLVKVPKSSPSTRSKPGERP